MNFYSLILIILVLSTFGCTPSLLFTNEQFSGVYSDTSIPEKWHGQWSDEEHNCYIAKDSFSIGGLDYIINHSEMNFGRDSADGKDKLIFREDWCFLCRYVEEDSVPSLSGYQVLVANIDVEGNINCWEMSYDYFLRNRIVNRIPTIKFSYTNITKEGGYQKIEPRIVYAELPKELSKHEFNRLIKNTSIATGEVPFFCDNSYDIDFFKNIANSRTPDLVLTKSREIMKRKENQYEKKYKKISAKNTKRKYFKLVAE